MTGLCSYAYAVCVCVCVRACMCVCVYVRACVCLHCQSPRGRHGNITYLSCDVANGSSPVPDRVVETRQGQGPSL